MLRLKLNHVSKRGHRSPLARRDMATIKPFAISSKNSQFLRCYFATQIMQIKTSQRFRNSDFGLKTLCGYFATPIMQI